MNDCPLYKSILARNEKLIALSCMQVEGIISPIRLELNSPSSHSHCTQSVKWCLVDFEHFPLIWLDDLVPFYLASLLLEITSQLNL